MATRKEVTRRIIKDDGSALTIRVIDGAVIDDLLVASAKAEAYRVVTGKDVFPDFNRTLKDTLIKIKRIPE